MTSEKEAESLVICSVPSATHCLICHSRLGVSSRNSVEIFTKNLLTDDRPVSYSISAVLGDELQDSSFHSQVICKKCYKLLYELDEIDSRGTEIKEEIRANYKRTLDILEEEKNPSQESVKDSDRKLPLGSDDGNVVKYKLLVPKGRKKITPKKMKGSESDEESEQKENTIDVAMIDHDSDSDFTLELPQEGQEMTVEHDGEQIIVQIKMEPDDDDDDDASDRETKPKRMKRKIPKEEEPALPEKLINKEETDFTCCLCPDEEKAVMDIKGVIAHLKTVHNVRVYICDICGLDFKKRNELSVHLDEHVATEEGDFQCEVCNRIFSNLRLFRVHKRMHYPQSKLWTCDTCGKRYSSRNLLEEHTNIHTGSRPYVCQVCGKDFASKYTYKAHAKTHEIRPRPYVCGECHKSFLSPQNLQQHERTHSEMKNYVCDQCGKAFGTARNLEVHSVVHSGFKPFICRVCGKAFARKAEIRDHERTHTGEKPYQCEFCGATFSQRSNLQSHKRATHYQDKRYKCNDCGKGFKRRRLLDYHLKAAHTGERPFKCSTCDATFVYPEHYKKHRRIHTGEKPFLCEVCGKAFNSRDNRNAHRFVHSDKKPYECLVCGTGFMRKPLLYNHMQTRGHLNDTIVVNQPRLTTDDDMIVESSIADLNDEEGSDTEIIAGHSDADTKLYISELKEHVIIREEDEHGNYIEKTVIVGSDQEDDEEELVGDPVNHLIIDGQVHFADPNEIVNMHGDIESVAEVTTTTSSDYDGSENRGRMVVVPATPNVMSGECYEEQITGDQDEVTLTDLSPSQELVQMNSNGQVHLVQIQLPSGENPNGNRWINIVNQE